MRPTTDRIQHIAAGNQVPQSPENLCQREGILMQQACGQPQYRDLMVQQLVRKPVRIQHALLVDHDDPRPVQQWRPHFQCGGIESRIGSEGHPVLRSEISVAVVDGESADRPMRHHNALRATGRSGGVHHIGALVRVDPETQVLPPADRRVPAPR